MTVEAPVTTIDTLNAAYPAHGDNIAEADSHIRNIKSALKTTFAGVAGPTTITHGQLNELAALFSGNLAGEGVPYLQLIQNVVWQNQPTGWPSGFPPITAQSIKTSFTINQNLTNTNPLSQMSFAGIYSAGPIAFTDELYRWRADGVNPGSGGFAVPAKVIPDGTIIRWFRATGVTTYPPGWLHCDGTNGTPNLVSSETAVTGGTVVYLIKDNWSSGNMTAYGSAHWTAAAAMQAVNGVNSTYAPAPPNGAGVGSFI